VCKQEYVLQYIKRKERVTSTSLGYPPSLFNKNSTLKAVLFETRHCVCVGVSVRAHAYVRARVRVCMRGHVHVRVRVHARVRVCMGIRGSIMCVLHAAGDMWLWLCVRVRTMREWVRRVKIVENMHRNVEY